MFSNTKICKISLSALLNAKKIMGNLFHSHIFSIFTLLKTYLIFIFYAEKKKKEKTGLP